MRRRDFITVLGTAAAAWPLAARAQPPAIPVVGFLGVTSAGSQPYLVAFRQGLSETGYVEGQSVAIEYRWAEDQYNRLPELVADLIRHHVNVIATMFATLAAQAAKATTTTIPIVFSIGDDPVKHGLVASLSRPGGNLTGFTPIENSLGGKWVELLKEIAPRVARVTMVFDPAMAPFASYYLNPFKAAAVSLGMEAIVAPVDGMAALEGVVATSARESNTGLVVMPDAFTIGHHADITSLVARYRVPTVYPFRIFAEVGGLVSYGSSALDEFRRAASYVDRILKGAKPSELPVQTPINFDLVINLKTAKALGLDVPSSMRLRADEVIE
jgi:putative tryptophan/tyrosine transport system substrate-binding protein